jgi:hypothetical protein
MEATILGSNRVKICRFHGTSPLSSLIITFPEELSAVNSHNPNFPISLPLGIISRKPQEILKTTECGQYITISVENLRVQTHLGIVAQPHLQRT